MLGQQYGYFGVQQVESRGTVVFSVWDNSCGDVRDPMAFRARRLTTADSGVGGRLRPGETSCPYTRESSSRKGGVGARDGRESPKSLRGSRIFCDSRASVNPPLQQKGLPGPPLRGLSGERVGAGGVRPGGRLRPLRGRGHGVQVLDEPRRFDLGEDYGFVVQAFDEGMGKVRFDGYFHAEELGGWVLAGKLRVNSGSNHRRLYRMYSFVEQWTEGGEEEAGFALFGPMFVETYAQPGFTEVMEATFSHPLAQDASSFDGRVTEDGARLGVGVGGDLARRSQWHAASDAQADGPQSKTRCVNTTDSQNHNHDT